MDINDKTTDSEVKEVQPDYVTKYTYSDYLEWDDDERWELIDGVAYMMSAPNRQHQGMLVHLCNIFYNFLKGKPCKVYVAPFDVRLNADTFDDTVVQPDLVVICDHSKLDPAGCKGAPDLAIEILSPSTSKYDKTIKFEAYRKAGIREYWVISPDPDDKSLAVNILKGNDYITYAYLSNDIVPVHVLEGLTIDLSEVYAALAD